ncbi:unnamed protein product [Closterium sp. NIES-53]
MFQHMKDLVKLDDSGPKAWKLLRDVIQPNTLPMVIVLEKELAVLSMRLGDDVKPVLDKIKDTYARMAAAGSNVSQMQQCTKIISVLDNSWDNLIPTLSTQQDQWTPEWLRQQILQEDFPRRHTGGGAANKTAEGRPEGWAPPGMKPPSGERARGGAVQGSGAQGDGAEGKANPGMFLIVEDVKGSEGDVGSVGKVVMHPLTHWVIDSGCTSHMTPWADLLDEVKPPGKIKFVAAALGALLPVIGVGNAKVVGANGGLVGLGNVLLVEGLSANLLSVRRLQKSKAKVTFGPTGYRAKLGKLLQQQRQRQQRRQRQLQEERRLRQLMGLWMQSRWLKKAIYGLKQAPRAWYHKLEETLLAGGFKKSECDHSLFLLQEKEQFLMLLVYVDDILLFSKSSAMIEHVEEMLEMQFKCSKMGDVKYYLGMHVERDLDKGVLRLHQRKYCEGLAEKYGLQDGGKPATPLPSGFTVEPCADEEVVGASDRKLFHSMVGALNYAANHTRPDIAFVTSRLASVVSRPSHEQLEAAKRLVRYVSATTSVGLEYSAVRQRLQRGAADLGKGEMLLTCYTDASFNSMKADGTNIGGYVCLFGGGAVSWRNKKQNEEVVWLRRLLEEIGVCQKEPTVIFCDNESAVKLAKNTCLHGLTKHIRPKWHRVRRLLDKEVRLEIVKTHQ